jgi:hypothetical protein
MGPTTGAGGEWRARDQITGCARRRPDESSKDAGSIPATSTAPSASNVQVRAPLARGSARARTRSGHTRTRAHRSQSDHNGVVRPPAVVKGRPHAAEPGVARHVVRSTPGQRQPLVTGADRRRKRRVLPQSTAPSLPSSGCTNSPRSVAPAQRARSCTNRLTTVSHFAILCPVRSRTRPREGIQSADSASLLAGSSCPAAERRSSSSAAALGPPWRRRDVGWRWLEQALRMSARDQLWDAWVWSGVLVDGGVGELGTFASIGDVGSAAIMVSLTSNTRRAGSSWPRPQWEIEPKR